jgi:hypothetical protein
MQSPVVSAPPPKKLRSNESVIGQSRGNGPPMRERPADPIDDALTRRRKQLQELRRQQEKSDLLSKARSQLRPEFLNETSSVNSNWKPDLRINTGTPSTTSSPKTGIPLPLPQNIGVAGLRRENEVLPTMPKPTNASKLHYESLKVSSNANSQTPIRGRTPQKEALPENVISSMVSNHPTSTLSVTSNTSAERKANFAPRTPEIVRRLSFAPTIPPPESPTITGSSFPVRDTSPISQPPSLEPEEPQNKSDSPTHFEAKPSLLQKANGLTSASPRNSRPQRPPPITPALKDQQMITATVKPSNPNSANSSRQAFLSTMRESADSPSTASKRNSELELIRELKKVHQDKEDAFRQVVRLREQIQRLQRQETLQPNKSQELQSLVDIANRNGDQAALQWAREQAAVSTISKSIYPKVSVHISKTCTSFSSLLILISCQSPLSSFGRTASPSRRAMSGAMGPALRKRVTTPHPKRSLSNGEEFKLLAKATETNPDEFDSEVATYFVRRPYVATNDDLWKEVGLRSKEEYQASADVGKPSTLEIAAKIKADNSTLLLSGNCNVRHKKLGSTKWRIFEDIDEMDKPLGSVMFIDQQANEGEYWLGESSILSNSYGYSCLNFLCHIDEIYEEAMSTRDTYCASLIATASALKMSLLENQISTPDNNVANVPNLEVPVLTNPVSQTVEMQPTFDSKVHMEPPSLAQTSILVAEVAPPLQHPLVEPQNPLDMKSEPESASPIKAFSMESSQSHNNSEEKFSSNKPVKSLAHSASDLVPTPEKPKMVPMPSDEDGASDVLSVLLGFVFLAVYRVFYFLFIKLPFRLLILTSMASIGGALISLMWLYLADDNTASSLRAGLGYGFNRPGIE